MTNISRDGSGRSPFLLATLLAAALLINYVDRGSISIAAPLIQAEFALSPSQIGQALSAFFWAYALVLPATGWLTDRFGVLPRSQNIVLAGGSALTLPAIDRPHFLAAELEPDAGAPAVFRDENHAGLFEGDA